MSTIEILLDFIGGIYPILIIAFFIICSIINF